MAEDNVNLFSHSFRGQVQNLCQQGCTFSGGFTEDPGLPRLLLVASGIPWLVTPNVPRSSRGLHSFFLHQQQERGKSREPFTHWPQHYQGTAPTPVPLKDLVREKESNCCNQTNATLTEQYIKLLLCSAHCAGLRAQISETSKAATVLPP